MARVPMTVGGAESLREELAELKSVVRPRIIAAIAEAREHGDLKENAEYHAAREQQSFCEGRIGEIEGKLADSQIIDVTKIEATGRVIFGTTVTLLNIGTQSRCFSFMVKIYALNNHILIYSNKTPNGVPQSFTSHRNNIKFLVVFFTNKNR